MTEYQRYPFSVKSGELDKSDLLASQARAPIESEGDSDARKSILSMTSDNTEVELFRVMSPSEPAAFGHRLYFRTREKTQGIFPTSKIQRALKTDFSKIFPKKGAQK